MSEQQKSQESQTAAASDPALPAITLGASVKIDGRTFVVTKLAGKEIRLESKRPKRVVYRRVLTVQRLLAA